MRRLLPALPLVMLFLVCHVAFGQSNLVDPLDLSYKPAIDVNPADYPNNIWVTDAMIKVHQDSGNPGSVKWALPYAAKNEFESFQVHEQAGGSPITLNNVTVSDLVNAQTGTHIAASTNILVYREAYYNIVKLSDMNGTLGYTPDALIPAVDPYYHQTTNAFPYTIAAGKNQSIWIDILVPATAPSGYYQGTVTIVNNGSTYATLPVLLAVWNFSIPSTATLKSAYGSSTSSPCTQFFGGYTGCHNYPGAGTSDDQGVQLSSIDNAVMLLDHRVSNNGVIYFGPSNNIWTAFDASYGPLLSGTPANRSTLLSGASLTNVEVALSPPYTGLQNWITHFSANGWLAKLFVYSFDEPHTATDFSTAVNHGSLIQATSPPGVALVTTDLATATSFNALSEINIMVPILQSMEPRGAANQRSTYNNWLSSGNPGGNFLWMYEGCTSHGSCGNGTTGDATSTWPSTMIDATPIRNRIEQWFDYLDNVQGDLYYAVDFCWYTACDDGTGATGTDPWTHQYAFGGNGDGSFTYPGTPAKVGVTTPIFIPSLRLKLAREGFEDYEYLIALKNAGLSSFVNTTISAFVTNAYTFSTNGADLMTARMVLGNKLHQSSLQTITRPPAPTGITVTIQ